MWHLHTNAHKIKFKKKKAYMEAQWILCLELGPASRLHKDHNVLKTPSPRYFWSQVFSRAAQSTNILSRRFLDLFKLQYFCSAEQVSKIPQKARHIVFMVGAHHMTVWARWPEFNPWHSHHVSVVAYTPSYTNKGFKSKYFRLVGQIFLYNTFIFEQNCLKYKTPNT